MYSVKPIGINIKDNDRDVPDGFLQESINMQWRDGAFKPIPERIVSDIDASFYNRILFHKVADENQINVLGFNDLGTPEYLAFDLSSYLCGSTSENNKLYWFGTITDGVYASREPVEIAITRTPGLSFTILNGLIYFMGDGSDATEQYYLKLEFDDTTGTYKVYDMYAWKTLIPYYPQQAPIAIEADKKTFNCLSVCGVVLVRFALVLKSGDIVLPSPIYVVNIYGINRNDVLPVKGDLIENIHAVISMNMSFGDMALFENEIASINIYSSIPYYKTKLDTYSGKMVVYAPEFKMITELANQPFYLLKTINSPTSDKLILSAGPLDSDITFDFGDNFSTIKMDSIAAGEIMTVDDFTYHSIYGKITSYNGRLVIKQPQTVLSAGHVRALATQGDESIQGYSLSTEDGNREQIYSIVDKSFGRFVHTPASEFILAVNCIQSRGIISYPDYRGFLAGGNDPIDSLMYLFKSKKNTAHNLSCCYDFVTKENDLAIDGNGWSVDGAKLELSLSYDAYLDYFTDGNSFNGPYVPSKAKYTSGNRLQFSDIGEFRVWPAINSYRVGEGKVMALGTGSVNPSDSFVISPIIVGTTDGIYTINLDPTGNNFISSITKTASIPFLSEEILEIDNAILFVSDQGLMVFSNGDFKNLTKDYFPQQGNGNFPNPDTIFEGYNITTSPLFGEGGNPYHFDDIVRYMTGAVLAFDSRRNNIWCSNPAYPFSMVYNTDMKQWGMSTMVFSEKQELFSIVNTEDGELYSRYMVLSPSNNSLLILSGEDNTKEVFYHILTRPVKFQNTDDYKVLKQMISRCLLVRDTTDGYLSFGLWGQQDIDRNKKAITLALKKDDRADVFPGNIRYHIPINSLRGKYKSVTVLQAGKGLPDSYLSSFDFDVYLVDNKKMR